ncbi:MAG TPA: TMEM175 family protein [Candidatus Angelobacter sp.]|nr:TMEM175 family protein [Candidatus Angelobacter sp.]
MSSYNQIAGRSVERLAALSDGIFAVAMTLLVLDLHVPVGHTIHTEQDLWKALVGLSPRILIYLMSFLTLGIFWVGQQAQLNYFKSTDRNLTWLHIAFLFTISLMPFSTSLLAEFVEYRVALLAYWLNILLLGIVLYGSWRYAARKALFNDEVSEEVDAAVRKRIVVAQSLYALGAALCAIGTYFSIAFIVLIQLNYAIGIGFRRSLRH